jgi:small neutral amino acid transporter SnatA (MarC family)
MLLAIILITVARISSKKLTDAVGKYRRLFIYNFIALVLILLSIQMSGRGFLGLPAY